MRRRISGGHPRLGVDDQPCALCTLGHDPIERPSSYPELFKYHVDGKLLEEFRFSVNKGIAIGNGGDVDEVENLIGRRMSAKKMGRLVGWRRGKADK